MYEKILLTTDGSEESEAAFEHAESLAENYDAELHILYVVDIGVDTSITAVEELMEQLEENNQLQEHGIDTVGALSESASEDVEVKEVVESGTPTVEIRNYAEEKDIDLIVMATQGRSGLDRVLLGSVTEKVIRSANVPVLAVDSE